MSLAEQVSKYAGPLKKRLARPWVRFVALTLYYLAILIALFALYGKGNFSTPNFIYQNF
jgi:hypothetical protein